MKRLLLLTEAAVSQLSNGLEPVVILFLAVVCAVTWTQMCFCLLCAAVKSS